MYLISYFFVGIRCRKSLTKYRTKKKNDFREESEIFFYFFKRAEVYLEFRDAFQKQAENGLQSQSGCHGLSWTIMDYRGLSLTVLDCPGLLWTVMDCYGLLWLGPLPWPPLPPCSDRSQSLGIFKKLNFFDFGGPNKLFWSLKTLFGLRNTTFRGGGHTSKTFWCKPLKYDPPHVGFLRPNKVFWGQNSFFEDPKIEKKWFSQKN